MILKIGWPNDSEGFVEMATIVWCPVHGFADTCLLVTLQNETATQHVFLIDILAGQHDLYSVGVAPDGNVD